MLRRAIVVVLTAAFVAMFAACGWDWTVVPKSEPSDGGEAGLSKDGLCSSNDECRTDELCFFADGRCGAGSRGICNLSPVPKECSEDAELAPHAACGCDGKTAANECTLGLTRTSPSVDAACPSPPDTFRCGHLFCPRSTYCFEDRGPKGTGFFCIDWSCAERTCACQDTTGKCPTATCSSDGTGATTVVCTQVDGK